MKLNEFINRFLQDNTLFRVLVRLGGDTTPISGDWETVSIVHLFKRGLGSFKDYTDKEVVCLTDVEVLSTLNREVVNIVIKL